MEQKLIRVPSNVRTNVAPAAAGRRDELFVFVKDLSGQILFNQAAPGGAFVGWQTLPGVTTDTAVGAGMQADTLFVFARDQNGQVLFNQASPGGAFVGWQEMQGGVITDAAPTAAGRSDNLFVFVRSTDGRILFNQAAPGSAFVGWQEVPGGVTTNIAVGAGMQADTLFVFAKDQNGQVLFNQAAPGGAFAGWQTLPGVTTNAAPVAAGRRDDLFVFVRDLNGQILFNQAAPGGAFVGWQEMPGGLTTNLPLGVGMQADTLFVFARDNHGQILFNQAAPGGTFVGWQALTNVTQKPQWTEQRPGPAIVNGDGYTQVSGAVQALAHAPTTANPHRIFAASASGGIWRTDDISAENPVWFSLSDYAGSLSIGCIAVSPLDPNHDTVFAGISSTSHGSPINGANHGPLLGILMTSDGGSSWTLLGQSIFQDMLVPRVLPTAIMTTTGQLVFATTDRGLYRSEDAGHTWKQWSGYNGQLSNGLPDAAFADVIEEASSVLYPGNSNRLYTAANNPPRIFRSEDEGKNWNELTAAIGLPTSGWFGIKLAVSPRADHYMYLGLGRVYSGADEGYIFFSRDNGDSWSQMDQPPDGSKIGNVFTVSAGPEELIFVYSDKPARWVGNPDAGHGAQWVKISGESAGGTDAHTDGRDMISIPGDYLLEVNDGGVYRLQTNIVSPRWASAIGNLRVTEFLSVAYDNVNHIIFGACQDNAIPQQTTPGSSTWGTNEDFSGDGMCVRVDNLSSPAASIHYSSQQNFFHFRRRIYTSPTHITSDISIAPIINGTGGLTWNFVEGALTPNNGLGTIRWSQDWAINAADPTRILLGTDYLYESFDCGDHFDSLGGLGKNIKGEWIPVNPVGTVTAYAYGHKSNPDVIYVGAGGKLWVRTDRSGHPTATTTYPGSTPFDIALDRGDWQRAYILDDQGRIWRTNDAGASGWNELTGNLHNLSNDLRTIETFGVYGSPGGEVIFVGGYGGVYTCAHPEDGKFAAWHKHGENFPNVIVSDMRYDTKDDILIAGTFGRGVWRLDQVRATILYDATLQLTWPTPANIVYGTPLDASELNAAEPFPGTFVYTPPGGTLLDAGKHTLGVLFTPDDTANYGPTNGSVQINIVKAIPIINWANPSDIDHGTPISSAQLNAVATWVVGGNTIKVPGTYTYSPTAGTVLTAGIHTLSVLFTPDDIANYSPATASVQITVLKATPIINWGIPPETNHGVAIDAAWLNATATWRVNDSTITVPGTFTYSPAAGTVLDVGIQQPLTVKFTPANGNNYLPATKTGYIDVKGPNLGTQISFMSGRDAITGARAGCYVVTEVDTKRVLTQWYASSGSTDSGPFTTLPLSFASVHVTIVFYPDGGGAPITMKVLNPAPGTEYGWATRGECAVIEVEYP